MDLDGNEILNRLPHRPPFVFLDAVEGLEEGVRGVGVKTFKQTEFFFAGHFPGLPIVPAVILTESMAQAAGIVMGGTSGGTKMRYVAQIREMRFSRPVLPGQTVRVHVEAAQSFGQLRIFRTRAEVGGVDVAQGEITLAEITTEVWQTK
jgi:3-hydroxyacyl-[acyl-carrier-protein] dehydratase